MKRFSPLVAIILCSLIILPACVSKRKYRDAMHRVNNLHSDSVAMANRIRAQQDSINASMATINGLNNDLYSLNGQYSSTNKELKMSKAELSAQRQRLMQLQALIDQQQKNTEALRKTIADALTGFNTSELTVSMKNGKVYVSMQESLLFPSGSAVVNPKGKEALSKLAAVLNTNTNINVDIEGHTDSVRIHNKMYPDNWALSLARANSITHVLIDDYAVSPERIIASGRSQYDPVASNGSTEGRARNRRTEIILEPKLDELMNVINGANPTGSAQQ